MGFFMTCCEAFHVVCGTLALPAVVGGKFSLLAVVCGTLALPAVVCGTLSPAAAFSWHIPYRTFACRLSFA